jgi:ABC-type taurine transport system ATPase subunit
MRAAAGKAERDPLWRVLRNTSERTIAGSQRSHGRPLGYQIAVKLQTDTGRESTLSLASGIRHLASGLVRGQRLAIAWARVHDLRILILGEPSRALDAGSESKVKVALATLFRDRTTLIAAHRPSTIQEVGRIVARQTS